MQQKNEKTIPETGEASEANHEMKKTLKKSDNGTSKGNKRKIIQGTDNYEASTSKATQKRNKTETSQKKTNTKNGEARTSNGGQKKGKTENGEASTSKATQKKRKTETSQKNSNTKNGKQGRTHG